MILCRRDVGHDKPRPMTRPQVIHEKEVLTLKLSNIYVILLLSDHMQCVMTCNSCSSVKCFFQTFFEELEENICIHMLHIYTSCDHSAICDMLV